MTNAHHEYHEPIVLDRGNHSIVANAIAPESLVIARQRLTKPTWVVASSDTFSQIAEHSSLGICSESAQVANCRTIKFDAPSRHSH